MPEFVSVMAAVEKGEADFGVVPIENSSTGGITDIYDHMNEYDVHIVGEQIIKIEHALIGHEGVDVKDIKTVYSHAQGIRQCAGFLKAHPWIHPVEVGSTAQGAKRVADDHDPSKGAIAGVQAAKVYDLNVIENAINDQGNNRTRFVILTRAKNYINNSKKISISFEVESMRVVPYTEYCLIFTIMVSILRRLNHVRYQGRPGNTDSLLILQVILKCRV